MFIKISNSFCWVFHELFLSQLFALEGVDDVLEIQILDFL
jgi:hypothetical protein